MSQDAVVQSLVAQLGRLQEQVEKLVSRTVVSNNSAYFSAYANATTPLTGTTAIVALGGTKYTDGHFASNVYTCPVNGNYLVCGGLYITATAAGYCYASIYAAGAEQARGTLTYVAAGQLYISTVAVVMQLAAGNTIGLYGTANGGGTANAGQQATYLTGQIQ